MNIRNFLSKKVNHALIVAGVPLSIIRNVQVRKSVKSQFGDYQVNGVMAVAKKMDIASRQLAKKIVNLLELDNIVKKIEIQDPGFINIFLNPQWLAVQLSDTFSSPRLGITQVVPKTIVIDYSSPNVAKEMHVGHLRSTIIGDATARVLSFLGHNIIRVNHIGDWGTQFGMLMAYLENIQCMDENEIQITDLENFYREAKKNYDKDPDFANRSRSYVVKLQNGNKHCRRIWRKLVHISLKKNQEIYDRLNVTLTNDDVMGESIYHNMLPDIVDDLKNKGLAVELDGAIVVLLEEKFQNKQGGPMGVIIQKKDGAYLYTTTDIACAKYRYEQLKADRIIYYMDSRQHQHLMQVWSIVRKAGYVPQSVPLEHHMFGMMLDKNGKPFKTRSGKGIVKLTELLDEALERARCLILTKNPNIKTDQLERLAQVVGIGAVKYADLSKSRTTNYVFDWNNMLSFEGNTAPYIQYAYTRVISIFKRSSQNAQTLKGNIVLETEQEIQLAVCLLQFEEIIITVAQDGIPHVLCAYLYNLSSLFSYFYETCPIIQTTNEVVCHSRLKLALLTARTLKQGLNLLGIETIEHM